VLWTCQIWFWGVIDCSIHFQVIKYAWTTLYKSQVAPKYFKFDSTLYLSEMLHYWHRAPVLTRTRTTVDVVTVTVQHLRVASLTVLGPNGRTHVRQLWCAARVYTSSTVQIQAGHKPCRYTTTSASPYIYMGKIQLMHIQRVPITAAVTTQKFLFEYVKKYGI
jgi:hypothetical protein